MENFRAICAALLDEIPYESPTTCLALAALKESQVKGPTEKDIFNIISWMIDQRVIDNDSGEISEAIQRVIDLFRETL
jgi:hypothetical protein